jgi:hypothetical protein
MDKLQFNAEITDVKWVTTTTGIVNPVLVLDKEYEAIKEKDSQKFDGIMVLDFKEIENLRCGIGSKVVIECNEQLVPMVTKTLEASDTFKFPRQCIYCGSDLQTMDSTTVCVNHLCIAQGRTPIFKLIMACNMVALDREGVVDVHRYLNDFPYKGDFSRIEHLYAYLQMLFGIKDTITTQARKDILTAKFGDKEGSGLWMFEFMILQKLEKGLPPNEFWYVMGLPFQEKDLEKIHKVDVFEVDLTGKVLRKIKLSQHGQQVVFDNNGLLKLVITTMEKFIK